MRWSCFMLVWLAVTWTASASDETLGSATLQSLDARLQALEQYKDNAFLYEDKMQQLLQEAQRTVEGRQICLPVTVHQVTRQEVINSLASTSENRPPRAPHDGRVGNASFPTLILYNSEVHNPQPDVSPDSSEDAPDTLDSSRMSISKLNDIPRIGGTFASMQIVPGRPHPLNARSTMLKLEIGTAVGLDTAKELRRGDRLDVCGTIQKVLLAQGRYSIEGFAFLMADPTVKQPDAVAADGKTETTATRATGGSWKAFTVAEDGKRVLRVEGIVRAPTPGHYVDVATATPQGFNPRILILDAKFKDLPGMWTQVITPAPACFRKPVEADQYDQVMIRLPNGQSPTVDVIAVEAEENHDR